jgi:hypothetical protein
VLLAIGLIQFVCSAAAAADVPATLDSWVAIEPLAPESEQMDCANSQHDEWQVAVAAGDLRVKRLGPRRHECPPPEPPRPPEFACADHVLRFDEGNLVGIDRGEFGGGLWWFPAVGQGSLVSSENVHGLFQDGSTVVVFVGLAHGITDEGAIVEIVREDTGWRIARRISLGSSPETWTRTADGALVVTGKGISRYRKGTVTRLHKSDYLPLGPNSVVAVDGTIFIGMRYAVARLTPRRRGFVESWLVPPWCVRMVPRDYLEPCQCVPRSGKLSR